MAGAIFSSSCLSSLNSAKVFAGLSGMMTGGVFTSGTIFSGKALQDALADCSSRGILVFKRGKGGFFLEDSIIDINCFKHEVMEVLR